MSYTGMPQPEGYPSYPLFPQGASPAPTVNMPVPDKPPLGFDSTASYPPAHTGYPAASGYPPQPQPPFPVPGGGYPPQNTGYPPQNTGYPPQNTGYPLQNMGYPQNTGYPPQSTGYPPNNAGYPPHNTGYPLHNAGYPPHNAGHPPMIPNPTFFTGAINQMLNMGQSSESPHDRPPPTAPAAQPSPYSSQFTPFPSQPSPYSSQYTPSTQTTPYSSSVSPGQPSPYSSHGSTYTQSAPHTAAPPGMLATAPYHDLNNSLAAMAIASTAHEYTHFSGTVKDAVNFNAETDCQVLRKAMKGLGTDEKALINVLAYRSNRQRQEIKIRFKTLFGRDLIADLKSELSGRFLDTMKAMMKTPAEFDASQIKHAITGAGTDDDALVEIMGTRTNQQIHEIKQAYKLCYKKELEKDLSGDTSGHYRKLLISLSTGGRDEHMTPDRNRAIQDAQALYAGGVQRLGTDESKFIQILGSQSFAQLRLVFEEYAKISRTTIEKSIKSEMSGNLEKGLLTIVRCVQSRPAYFAEQMNRAMKGAGTKDKMLIRLVVSRSEIDMVQIKQEYQRQFGRSLEADIRGDTSGDYRRCLQALVAAK